jgi:hypothetical protein
VAESCHASVKPLGFLNREIAEVKLTFPSVGQSIPIDWNQSGRIEREIDLPHSDDFLYGALKVPHNIFMTKDLVPVVEFATKQVVIHSYDEPLKELVVWTNRMMSNIRSEGPTGEEVLMVFAWELTVTAKGPSSQTFKKTFVVVMPASVIVFAEAKGVRYDSSKVRFFEMEKESLWANLLRVA